MLEEEVNNNPDVSGFIFDGFPRTVAQAESLDVFLKGKNEEIGLVIQLDVNEDEIKQRIAERKKPGLSGKDGWVVCELKVLADVGLVGLPNAGKSTLLSVVSAAKPEIGNYAFTTLTPNLGVVQYHDYKSFIMADIPGIIEGASEGKGLGLRFLRHIERNSILLFLVSAESEDVEAEYKTLLDELKKYNPELLDKNRILGISKIDTQTDINLEEIKKKLPQDIPVVFFSSLNLKGINELKDILWNNLA
ncbi:UNVERIFIED_CONTAM: hypothetical protein GTU68_024459 [Idotea baltica]|nr:hypothetical protein [Idotea baltica]